MIRVSIEEPQPLTGSVAARHGDERRFRGWLELLEAMSELVDPDPPTRPATSGSAGCEHGDASPPSPTVPTT